MAHELSGLFFAQGLFEYFWEVFADNTFWSKTAENHPKIKLAQFVLRLKLRMFLCHTVSDANKRYGVYAIAIPF